MSGDEKVIPEEGGGEAEVARTGVTLAYRGASDVVNAEGAATLTLFGDLRRAPVQMRARVKDPLRFREALSALHAIVSNDATYKPKDRTAYMAYLRMKKASAGQSTWEAQRAYFAWMARNDPSAFLLLDPVVTAHPDATLFEVFSRDEGLWACLALHAAELEPEGEQRWGTTNIDFSDGLFQAVQRMRSTRTTHLAVGQEAVSVQTEAVGETLEKQIEVPDTWLRAFLQVQSAASLPMDHFTLAPLDLYNALRHLRMHADVKRKRRGLRVELIPGERPRLVLEPWETLIDTRGEAYRGRRPRVVRVWGRRRLMLVRRLLPFLDRVDVYVLGSGLPSFWVLRGQGFDLTLGLSGFTAANWSQALAFDLLLPRRQGGAAELEKVLAYLGGGVWAASAAQIGEATGLSGPTLQAALQHGCQHGRLMVDVARNIYRLRPLTEAPVDLDRIEYRNLREREAHDLLVRKGAVKIEAENRIHGEGLELTGKVTVAEDKRDYRPQVLLEDEGQPRKVECTCAFYRKNGLKQGPCAHVIALIMLHQQEEAARLANPEAARRTVSVETRTYSRREEREEQVVQLTLHRARLKVRWGKRDAAMRVQNLVFNSVDEARDAYFARVDELERKGYLDATAG